VSALADRCAETGEPFTAEYRYLAKDGHIVWVLDRATLRARDSRGFPAHFQGVMLDITARKEAEAKAEAAEERYRQLAERGPMASYVFRVGPELAVEYVSPQIDALVGYPMEEMRASPSRWLEIVHPDDRERVTGAFRHALETGASLSHEYRVIRGDGEIVWLRTQATLVDRDEEGRPSRFQGTMLDVTAEREAAEEIVRSEEALRALVEGLPAVPWAAVSNPASGIDRYTYIGPQSLAVLGYTPEELIAEPSHFGRMVHPEDRERVERVSKEADRTGSWHDRYRVIARDGSVRYLRGTGRRTITDEGVHVWHGVTFDETAWVLSLEDEARAPARAGTDAASQAAPPNRPPAGGSPAAR
jgi:PAS domain S-box-containing protein